MAALIQVVDSRLETMIEHRRLAFCFSRAPMVYPTSMAEYLQGVSAATTVFQMLNNYSLFYSELASELEREIGESANVSCYISRAEQDRFGVHWDDWHVAAFHLAETKAWTVEGANAFVLRPGDCVFIRRGSLHQTSTPVAPGPAVHLSVAIGAHTRLNQGGQHGG
jgi:hypothetical protein